MASQLLIRKTVNRSVLVLLGSSVAYGFHSRTGRLRTESSSDVDWPHARPIVASQKEHGNVQQPPARLGAENTASAPPEASTEHGPEDEASSNDDSTTWAAFTSKVSDTRDTVSAIEWSSLGDTITTYIIPDWAKALPGYFTKLQRELDMAPGSLADEIWQEAHDPDVHPEITREARVRIGKGICNEEKAFLKRRKEHTTKALARYLGVPEEEVDPEDVPTIAICGSGGGLRALVAGAGSYLAAQEAGLFDCVTYTAGVSGSCWLQALYNSSLGGRRYDTLVEHLKRRIGVHIAFPPTALGLLTTAPTNKFLLSGFVEKLKGDPSKGFSFNLVDLYGILLASRLLVPRGELGVDDRDLKLSSQRAYVDHGANPLPLYTAVRHEIPIEERETEGEKIGGGPSEETKEKAKQEAWFQWFEFSPYEFWCEELEAGIPTWSIGRRFHKGYNVPPRADGFGLPELRVPFLMGIWGSAFCATLSHYYKEIRPLFKGLTGFGGLDGLIEGRNDDLIKVHPIDPAHVPNYVLGLEDKLPSTCPKSLFSAEHLQLMDAGMSNNLPIYPLLRPGREVDILIAFDASADIKSENWLSVADGYARQRGIKAGPSAPAGPPPTPPPPPRNNSSPPPKPARPKKLPAKSPPPAKNSANNPTARKRRSRPTRPPTSATAPSGSAAPPSVLPPLNPRPANAPRPPPTGACSTPPPTASPSSTSHCSRTRPSPAWIPTRRIL
ncbi:MAG: phospholipase A2 [Lasallia pustulata]|uniref:Lysophospholipase n=1 Tax=Lasallia pustulata TaxID=136370 RepID=A0A5M8PDB0_9LECA|nr:MAG: phospholipase A2 [Lasallia pustulata]